MAYVTTKETRDCHGWKQTLISTREIKEITSDSTNRKILKEVRKVTFGLLDFPKKRVKIIRFSNGVTIKTFPEEEGFPTIHVTWERPSHVDAVTVVRLRKTKGE